MAPSTMGTMVSAHKYLDLTPTLAHRSLLHRKDISHQLAIYCLVERFDQSQQADSPHFNSNVSVHPQHCQYITQDLLNKKVLIRHYRGP